MIDKIKTLAPESGLIGGRVRLITGALGACFEAFGPYPDYYKMQRRFKEDDEIPIIRVREDAVSIVPFFQEIWIKVDVRFKGISYLTNK